MLIKFNDNLLVNTDLISVVEVKKIRGIVSTVLWIDGRSYILQGDVSHIFEEINNHDKKQYFVG